MEPKSLGDRSTGSGHDDATAMSNPEAHSARSIDNEKVDSEIQASPESVTGPPRPTGWKWAAIATLILSNVFFYAVDNTVVAIIQPAIIGSLGELNLLQWISVGFLLPGAATAFVLGKLYEHFNARTLYITFALLFLVGSVICGAAPNMTALIFGRVIGGLGGTGMYLGALTLITVLTTPKTTPLYMGYLAFAFGIGSVVGPLIGGGFASNEHATWRWGFYICVVVIGASLPAYLLLLPAYQPPPNAQSKSRFRTIDWVGAVLSIGFFTAFVMALSFGGSVYAWNSAQTIALFVVGGCLLILFVLQQHFTIFTDMQTRLAPLHLFKSKDLTIAFVCQACVAFVVPIPLYYLPLYFQFARHDSSIRAAVKLLPFIILWITTSIPQGQLMGKLGYHQPWYIGGSILLLVGGVFLSLITPQTSDAVIYGLQVVVGVGLGCFGQAGFAVAPRFAEEQDMHKALALILVSQLSGTVLGLAVGGTVFQNSALSRVHSILPTFSIQQIGSIVSGTNSALLDGLTADQRAGVTDAFSYASSRTFILIYALAATTLVSSSFFTPKKIF